MAAKTKANGRGHLFDALHLISSEMHPYMSMIQH
jgi:hypothetical protein